MIFKWPSVVLAVLLLPICSLGVAAQAPVVPPQLPSVPPGSVPSAPTIPPDFELKCETQQGLAAHNCMLAPIGVNPLQRKAHLDGCVRVGFEAYNTCINSYVNRNGQLYADYVIVGMLYAPPGNASNASSGNSTQVGTIIGSASNFTSGSSVSVNVSAGFVGNGGSVSSVNGDSSTTGASSQTSVSTTLTETKFVASGKDPADVDPATFHYADQFLLWVHPMITLNEEPTAGQLHVSLSVGPNEKLNLQWVSAGDLRHKTIDPKFMQDQEDAVPGQPTLTLTGLHVLTDQDIAQILAQDPFVNGSPDQPLDAARFLYIDSIILDASNNPKDQLGISEATVNTQQSTSGSTKSSSFGAGIQERTPFQSTSVTFTNQWSWTTTTSTGQSHGTSSSATVALASTNSQCCGIAKTVTCRVAVYEDLIWHSFAFVPEDNCKQYSYPTDAAKAVHADAMQAASVSQSINDKAASNSMLPFSLEGEVTAGAKPAPGVRVAIYRGDGSMVYRTVTDKQGGYAVANLPSGKYSVEIGAKSFALEVVEGKTARIDTNL